MIIPPHQHHAKLAMTRVELGAAYGLRPGLAMNVRIPYDVKDQRIRYSTLANGAYVPPYGDIHHRSETLRGVSDGALVLLWAPSNTGASHWRIGLGASLPLGSTVPDPIELGRQGKKHQHLQFGSGTFAPEMELGWSRAFTRTLLGTATVQATLPFADNDEGYRAPNNIRWNAGPSIAVGRLGIAVSATGQYQTVARWKNETDEGTGFSNGGLRLQITVPVGSRLTITPSLYRELYSQGFNDETFSQGTTLGLTIRRAFTD